MTTVTSCVVLSGGAGARAFSPTAEAPGRSLCKTCVHAESAGHLTREEDLYICRALIPPLREYAASETAEYVLVNGCALACQEHYERDEALFDDLWQRDMDWEIPRDHPASISWNSLPDGMDGRLW